MRKILNTEKELESVKWRHLLGSTPLLYTDSLYSINTRRGRDIVQFGFNTSFLPVPLPFSTHTPGQPPQFPPHVHRYPSFHVPPKKTKTYTKSYKMPIQLDALF